MLMKRDLLNNTWSHATNDKFEDGEFVKTYPYEKRDHLLVEQDHFYKSILHNEKPMVSFKEGEDAVYFVDRVLGALESSGFCEV